MTIGHLLSLAFLLAFGLHFLNGCSGVQIAGTIGYPAYGDFQGTPRASKK